MHQNGIPLKSQVSLLVIHPSSSTDLAPGASFLPFLYIPWPPKRISYYHLCPFSYTLFRCSRNHSCIKHCNCRLQQLSSAPFLLQAFASLQLQPQPLHLGCRIDLNPSLFLSIASLTALAIDGMVARALTRTLVHVSQLSEHDLAPIRNKNSRPS
ncbi:hypothetical protein C2845_PM07G30330 [Panicum miliaceum]|uniref:Uncharacterized protein n=1 Tax=Panicum miliaceum TaxID=4540 RepID=A0A3L6SLH5_PANMI|nr:hypothetical protein C2845_PM07G30330 [Panicum miliaceum]